MPLIRLVQPTDAPAIHQIYAPIVQNSVISFETQAPSVSEIQQRIATITQKYPWLVYETASGIGGYAYASQHRSRAAYQWSVDVSVYVAESARGQGIGTQLYTVLFKTLKVQGFVQAFAGIALPNPASVALHEKMGFEAIGFYQNVGYKFGAWHDVGWWGLSLQPPMDNPLPPRVLSATEIEQILNGTTHL